MAKFCFAFAIGLLLAACVSASINRKIAGEQASFSVKVAPSYSSYIIAGYLDLPYAEIREPFTAYYDPQNKRSRIDYYDGTVKTFMRADKNTMYKIAYMSTETVMNQLTCFQVNGTSAMPVPVQSALPDLTGFGLTGQVNYNGHVADKWQFNQTTNNKVNMYIFIVDPVTKQPFRYEMYGYDSLFGSHYDHYIVEYTYYSANQPNADIFDPPTDLTCRGYPGPGVDQKIGSAEYAIEMNPMSEFISNENRHQDEMWVGFKRQHGKSYPTEKEHAARKALFAQNVRFVKSTNRAGKQYTVAINHLADRTDDELKVLRGFRSSGQATGGQRFNPAIHNLRDINDIPDTMDWRIYGAVTPVKDQAVCGSCWSFGTTGTIEGANFIKNGVLVRLSQQELMDCSWGEGNNACDGGEDWRAYAWIQKHGLSSEGYYGPYMGQDGMCHSNNVTAVVKITGYVNVTHNDTTALKTAIAMNGPISVAIDASHKSFSFYANGVYYEPQCGNSLESLDHAVLAVGYGTLKGQDYWLIKNSWSTYWGNDGYALMSPKGNNCGVMTTPTFVTL